MKKSKFYSIIFFDVILFFLVTYSLLNTELTVYGLAQARGQMKIVWLAERINKLEAEGKFSEEDKAKLELIAAVKKFSVDSLNYDPSDNYNTYFDQNGKSLLWIVTACAPYKLEAYEWKFPWLGEVSYKGYFDSTKAIKEYSRLKMLNYDADISRVSAWSTLGWFKDPVFSEMLKKSKADLAELIFHELFHGTIYAQNSVDLNENLANFISWKATMKFFENDTAALNKYKSDYSSDKEFDAFILQCSGQLDSVYKEIDRLNRNDSDMKQKKMQMILSFMRQLEERKFFSRKKTERIQKRLLHSANAYFMHFQRYDAMNDSLDRVFQEKYKGNLRMMITDLKSNIESL